MGEKKANETPEISESLVEEKFLELRASGFPNYKFDTKKIGQKFSAIERLESTVFLNSEGEKVYKKYQSFNGFLFSYFPHWISIPCGNSDSLENLWNDDEKLKKLIRKTLIWEKKHGEGWTENRLRQNAKVFLAGQTVSNFNPLVAKSLYSEFAPEGTVIDMCAGWGGRLLGFFGSSAKKYYGFEPSVLTFEGLLKLNSDYLKFKNDDLKFKNSELGENSESKETEIFCEPVEIELFKKNLDADFAFTSPPYFDTEKYAENSKQSYKKYETKEIWCEKFLGGMFAGVRENLKDGKFMAVNISNTKKYDWLEKECVEKAEKNGFTLKEIRRLELSSIAKESSGKYEPIFIFQKG